MLPNAIYHQTQYIAKCCMPPAQYAAECCMPPMPPALNMCQYCSQKPPSIDFMQDWPRKPRFSPFSLPMLHQTASPTIIHATLAPPNVFQLHPSVAFAIESISTKRIEVASIIESASQKSIASASIIESASKNVAEGLLVVYLHL